MPQYEFRSKTTGETFERQMKIAEKEEYLLNNSDIEQFHSAMAPIGDPVRLGVRTAGGFKEVLQKIHSRAPGSNLNTIANI